MFPVHSSLVSGDSKDIKDNDRKTVMRVILWLTVTMGNQNVKPAKRQAQVYPFNETEKKSRTDWTAGTSVSPSWHVAIPGTHIVCTF